MKLIDKYILNEIKIPVLFGVSLFTFIFLIDIIVAMMENIIVKGISIIDVIRILSFYLPPILSQTIPMGIFLGIMLTFSKFTRTSEATAMSAVGMSLKDIVKPVFIAACCITLFIFFLQESIIPRSMAKLQFLTAKIAYENPVFQLKEKTFIDEVDEYNLYIDRMDGKDKIAKGILIFQKAEDKPFPTVVVGEEAYWKDSAMVLKNSKFYNFNDKGKEVLRGEFDEKRIPLAAYFSEIEIKVKDLEAMGIGKLLKEMKDKSPAEQIPYKVEINKKLAVPLSTIMLSLLGVFLSIGHHRSGKGANFALSLIVIFSYITCLNVGMVMATKGIVPAFIGVWIPNLILFLLTLFMYKKKAEVI